MNPPSVTLVPALAESLAPRLEPTVLGEQQSATRLELDLRVPEDLAHLPGHFPETPIVPGVVQIDWVMRAIRRLTDLPVEILAIEALKFKQPLLPGDEFTLVVKTDGAGERYEFELLTGRATVSVGRVLLVASGKSS